jgi:hypothetical protein
LINELLIVFTLKQEMLEDVTTGCEEVKDEVKIEEHEILPIE